MSNVVLVLGLVVIIVILIRVISGNEKRKAKYDERMVIEQLKGYKYGAYGAAFIGVGIYSLELLKKDTLILTAGAVGFLVLLYGHRFNNDSTLLRNIGAKAFFSKKLLPNYVI